jgi:hypothetical protein
MPQAERISLERRLGQIQAELAEACRKKEATRGGCRSLLLQALLRELAAFNKGLCLITTRIAIIDLAEHEGGGSVLRLDLEHLSSQAGADLLRRWV